jgi:hypothetical protein
MNYLVYLLILALAAFFVWECLARPAVALLCSVLPMPDIAGVYLKSLTGLGVAFALDRWVDGKYLLPIAAASIAGTLSLLSRSSETPKMATVVRRSARRGMPLPGP